MNDTDATPVGFLGIGVMGEPMAINLARAGVPLMVWNRTPDRTAAVQAAGALAATDVGEVFRHAQTIILMLRDEQATSEVLGLGEATFAQRVEGRTIINMATVSPDYSRSLRDELIVAGAKYVEAPVSGQRPIAEAAGLVAMAAGDPDDIARITRLLEPMCSSVIPCGAVPTGLLMKLAVNLVSGAMMTAAAEGVHYARQQGLDLDVYAAALTSSSLSSAFLRMKLPKLVEEDYSVQGAIGVGRKDLDMMREQARAVGAVIPLLEICADLWDEAITSGDGAEDVSAVSRAFDARASRL